MTGYVVRCIQTEAEDSGAKSVVTFLLNISASDDGYHSYSVKRRFRQFDAVHTRLRDSYKGVPDLPPKQAPLIGKEGKAAFLGKRQAALSAFLSALLADPILAASDEERLYVSTTLLCTFQ